MATVNELLAQLKLAKNKEAEVIFRVGPTTLELELLTEVVKDGSGIRYPSIGEVTNAVAVKFKTPVVEKKESSE